MRGSVRTPTIGDSEAWEKDRERQIVLRASRPPQTAREMEAEAARWLPSKRIAPDGFRGGRQ